MTDTAQLTPDTAQLTMYSTPWCGYCHRLKRQLEREGIPFEVVDIEADPAAAAYVETVNGGNQTVPTVTFADGSALTNPSLAQVTGKLAELSATG
jgi:mycoredoxin